jgi:hypothetical protein
VTGLGVDVLPDVFGFAVLCETLEPQFAAVSGRAAPPATSRAQHVPAIESSETTITKRNRVIGVTPFVKDFVRDSPR